jgi:hypothetical protein
MGLLVPVSTATNRLTIAGELIDQVRGVHAAIRLEMEELRRGFSWHRGPSPLALGCQVILLGG